MATRTASSATGSFLRGLKKPILTNEYPCRTIGLRFASLGNLNTSYSGSKSQQPQTDQKEAKPHPEQPTKKHGKTQSELDEELRLKMEGLAGDGGEAGVELEDGQPVSMKRSVRNNMFRYI